MLFVEPAVPAYFACAEHVVLAVVDFAAVEVEFVGVEAVLAKPVCVSSEIEVAAVEPEVDWMGPLEFVIELAVV